MTSAHGHGVLHVLPVPFDATGEWPPARPARPAPARPFVAAPPPPASPPAPIAVASASVAAPRSPIDRVVDDLAQGPMGLYKRLVAYPPLAIVVFDTLTCRGLSPLSHAGLALLTAIGLAGVAAHAMADRG